MSGALFGEPARRELFPFVEECVYLAAAAETPLPRTSHEALMEFHADYLRRGCRSFPGWMAELERCRENLARLIGAEARDVALVKNTATGARSVAHSLPLAAGDRIWTNDREFPSNLWPWEDAARRADAAVERLPAPDGRPGAALVRRRMEEPHGPVRAITWSWVQYRDGFRVDLAELCGAARELGARVAVDGIQGLGAVPFSLAETPVDALYAGGHKWLMGLGGAGFLWVRRDWIPELEVFGRGWLSVEAPLRMDPDQPPRDDARRFEDGVLAFGHYFALRRSLDLLLEVGVEAIFAHVCGLLDHLVARVEAKGYRPASSLEPAVRGPILALSIPEGVEADRLCQELDRRGFFLTARDGRLRVAPHLYNTRAEMDALAEALPEG